MGLPMAQRLVAAGVPLVAYNRTASKLDPLKDQAAIAPSAGEVLQHCQGVITMLSNAQAIQSVLFPEQNPPDLAGCTIIQMSTIAPNESRSLRELVTAAGGEYLEAPVLGSVPQATSGELQIMVGATPEQFQQWSPTLQHLGSLSHIGAVGTASALKLALNQLIGSLTTAFAASLGFVQRQGVEVEAFMNILRESALYAPTFDKKLSRMVEGNFADPNFPTKHLLKDTKLFLVEARAAGLQVDHLRGVDQILEMAMDMGLADQDYSALYAAVTAQKQ